MKKIKTILLELQDPEYKKFHCALMPTVDPGRVIGVRMHILRALAKEIINSGETESFIAELPHRYYEENNLHGLIISREKDFNRAVAEVEKLLPYVDNWATCDLLDFKVFRAHKDELYGKILEWTASDHPYTVRFGIKMLMTYFLDGAFKTDQLDLVCAIRSEEYYVNMMRAWYFATALAKQYGAAVKIIEGNILDAWTHNKSIQKAIESYRVTDEHKAHLRALRRKEKGNV